MDGLKFKTDSQKVIGNDFIQFWFVYVYGAFVLFLNGKISSILFKMSHRRKNIKQVWKGVRVRNWWHIDIFGRTIPLCWFLVRSSLSELQRAAKGIWFHWAVCLGSYLPIWLSWCLYNNQMKKLISLNMQCSNIYINSSFIHCCFLCLMVLARCRLELKSHQCSWLYPHAYVCWTSGTRTGCTAKHPQDLN